MAQRFECLSASSRAQPRFKRSEGSQWPVEREIPRPAGENAGLRDDAGMRGLTQAWEVCPFTPLKLNFIFNIRNAILTRDVAEAH